jgi:hypothetical protein
VLVELLVVIIQHRGRSSIWSISKIFSNFHNFTVNFKDFLMRGDVLPRRPLVPRLAQGEVFLYKIDVGILVVRGSGVRDCAKV